MNIKEAKKILAKEAQDKSNKEIEQILSVAYSFAEIVLEKAKKQEMEIKNE